ncbi:hypothetical protein LTR91_017035 [Friedmanniomyces endolithicus]|uniref:Major facilitator superfamily (MFS) profile domain-containing protein n=1 Tax=Friedmanniomyces endolithicus TaxID=329885 RepID=A0AAN6K6Y7_9PEZI|nr:hypothetical protein LTR94_012387 [Friedmanniomyces endolithicus]KAK0782201.1 hypothetical protein LTR75_014455 [Friedmanniomyces endolithicus]KAK0800975.1 hypothetical protein LTR59_005544 [Friedmanniomyces endolithicus]KAK0818778.1 hypothetical protein LTR38_000876 [Friedmanniomyces endolithicus]KAK0855220.1 hypothetical protein LTR03_001986 [Friedmanniomyces endolithicus]
MSDIEKKGSSASDVAYQLEALDPREKAERIAASFVPPTPEEERKVIRKLDRRLLPLVFVLYSLAVLDRSNLGNARLAGLTKSIDLSGNRYAWLGTIFYISYILFQWMQMGWKQFPAHMWCAGVVMLWGFIATIQAATTSWGGLMTCRFFLAIAEAAYGPGVPLYLSYFYPREMIGFRHGVFISGAAMANAYGGALAYAITQIHGSIKPWQILFIIEGLPTCILAVVVFFLLPDGITSARFLTERDKQIALHFVARNQRLDVGKQQGLRIREMLEGFKDPKSWIPAFCYFGCNVSYASLPLFVPTIISEMGKWSPAQSNGLSAPPYLLCFFYIITVCWLSDRFKMRGPFCALSATIGAIGFIILATATKTGARYFALFMAVQIFASVALLLAWTANIHATESKRAGGYVVLATVGQCGPLLGTNVFPDSEKPYFRTGMWISAAFCLLVAILSLVLSTWLIFENRKMAREGVPKVEEYEDTSIARETGVHERHRYIW